jgi:succinate dehydrogenase / fumarate reductase flavoprotein subunit
LAERLPGITEAAHLRQRRPPRAGADRTDACTTSMGGIATNYHGEALIKKNGNPDHVVPGMMALGEARASPSMAPIGWDRTR